jgi:iron complex transport system substrate-binding protein
MKVRIQVLHEKMTHHPKRPRVFYVISMNPPMTVGPGSFIQEMIEKAGGVNLMKDAPNPYPLFNLEEVMVRNPDIILFSSEIGIRYQELIQQWARWDRIKAVSTHRLFEMDADLIDRPGPRIVEGLETLTGMFYDETVNP